MTNSIITSFLPCQVCFLAFLSLSTPPTHLDKFGEATLSIILVDSRGTGSLLRRMSCIHSRIDLSPARRDRTEGFVAIRLAFFRRSGQSSSDVFSQGSQGMRTLPPGDFGGYTGGGLASGETSVVHLTACQSFSVSHTSGVTVLRPASPSWDG